MVYQWLIVNVDLCKIIGIVKNGNDTQNSLLFRIVPNKNYIIFSENVRETEAGKLGWHNNYLPE